jgi:histone acetyltransferase (RNA polymerase elongator complex component)
MKILPVFIPFYGCKSRCIYCDQYAVTGVTGNALENSVKEQIERWLGRGGDWDEVAFYGGSFAFLPKSMREKLYSLLREYTELPLRISTCPDSISPEFTSEIEHFNIRTVELGIQSLSDKVLAANGRAYSAQEALGALASLKGSVKLSAQFMTGMYAEEREDLFLTAERAAGTGEDFARIYPTAVFENTELHNIYINGGYAPLSPQECLMRATWLYICLEAAGIRVIRVGLPPEAGGIKAGYTHPALGDMVRTLAAASYGLLYGAIPDFVSSGYKGILRQNLGLPKTNAVDTMRTLAQAIMEKTDAGDKWFAEKQTSLFAASLVL